MEIIEEFIDEFSFLMILALFLVVYFIMQSKANKQQAKLYADYLKDSMGVLEESTKQTKRIADILEKKYNGK